jgi:beta-N-acetylhexosaminidase
MMNWVPFCGRVIFAIFLTMAFTIKTLPVNGNGKKPGEKWIDSVFYSMTPEERLGQLFMIAAYSNKGESHKSEIASLIKEYNIGGLIFFQGGPVRQAHLSNYFQSISNVPLFMAMDAEWGLSMRLDSTLTFPRQMTLGAIQDNKLVYRMGEEVAKQCKRIGMQINFAPVVDINSNPKNPVIGVRSFGEDKNNVALKGIAYMKGMQDQFVLANAKHFPGHGDAGADSHYSLPLINKTKDELLELELYPFQQLIKNDIKSLMVAHLSIPSLDDTPDMASTLSEKVVKDLLQKDLGFKGLVFTDALNMKGVSSYFKPGDVDLKALLAGNDVLLFSENVPLAIKKILRAIKKNEISQEEIDLKVRKILEAKYWSGLAEKRLVSVDNLVEDLTNNKAKALIRDLYQNALTVARDDFDKIPIRVIDTATFASVSIGAAMNNEFLKNLNHYAPFSSYSIADKNADVLVYNNLLNDLKDAEVIVVGIHGTSFWSSRNYGINEKTIRFVEALENQNKTVIVCVFGAPYALKYFAESSTVICGYEDNDVTRSLVPQLIFGAFRAGGKLPVSVEDLFKLGSGLETNSLFRLQYSLPENVGMNHKTLAKIDSIAMKAIKDKATPGMQVLVAKDGKVVYEKSFGYLTYDNTTAVTENTIYDIASITKVAGTLQAIMFLVDRGELNLDKKASFYLPELKGTNKEDLLIKDILTHQAGLTPFIPHWKKTLDSTGFMHTYYNLERTDLYPNEVCEGLYSCISIEDTLWQWTIDSDLLKRKKKEKYPYTYSDLGFYIMKQMAERLLNQSIDVFMQQNFYTPLGLSTMTYKPLEKFPFERIAPTENDTYFRKSLVRGNVHDQGAAMLGGVAGHAGLFSNAHDLAILLQMNLQKGYYGGYRYFLPETIGLFSAKQFDKNRRGLGWDKPEPEGSGPTSSYASKSTFGHTGFTGTAAWIDPEQNLIYIYLSNRVYPDASNTKLIRNNVRTEIQDYIYKSILNYTYE